MSYGNGKHVQTLSIYQAEQVRLWNFAAFMPGVLVLGLPKVAVVILLNRLLNPSKWHRRFLWVMVVLCVLSNIATVGTLAGQCTPTKAMWNFDMDAKCIDPNIIIGFSLYSAGEFICPEAAHGPGPHSDLESHNSIQRFRGSLPSCLPSHCPLQASAEAQEKDGAECRIRSWCCVSCFLVQSLISHISVY